METIERMEESFAVGDAPRLLLANVKGSVTVQGEERADIQVTAVKHLTGQHPERTEIEMVQEGDCVQVKTRYKTEGDWLSRLRDKQVCDVDYTVQVPLHCAAQINQVAGAVRITGLSGDTEVTAVSGSVYLNNLSGRTQVDTVSAKVNGDQWQGEVQIKTVSGPVQLTAAHLSALRAHTVSGNVKLETTLDEAGRYDVHSVSGDVSLYLPEEQGLESRGSTVSGRMRCELPHRHARFGRGGWRVTINDGGPPVRFSSVSGNLFLAGQKAV